MNDFEIHAKKIDRKTTLEYGGNKQSPASIMLAFWTLRDNFADEADFTHLTKESDGELHISVEFLDETQEVKLRSFGFDYREIMALLRIVDNHLNTMDRGKI